MAKRSNPYVDDFVPQSKVHVGVKQFNNTETRLHEVYEKTLELLFRGAKNMPLKINTVDKDAPEVMNGKKDGLKQLFLGKNGNLMQSGVLTKHSANRCSCGVTTQDKCAYCDKTLCGSCQRPCELCRQPFCTQCSLVGSEESICVSCYR